MQKKFIALAVAGLVSGAAFAQSNVTVYGVADATFDVASATGASGVSGVNSLTGVANAANNMNRGSFTRVNSNSSYIGFKGTEALGNGLSAVFQIESAVGLDGSVPGGQTANTFGATRDSFVGLTGGFGTVVAGILTGPTRALGAAIDLNAGATGPGANSSLIGKIAGVNGGAAGTFDTRFANTIAYVSPNFSGLTATVAYVSGENKSRDDQGAAQQNMKGYDLGLVYNNGPVMVGLTYGKVDTGINGANNNAANNNAALTFGTLDTQKIVRLAGAYTFNGGHKITALYEQNKAEFASNSVNTDRKQNTWGLGGKFMVTSNGGLIAQYYQTQDASGNPGVGTNSNTGARLYEIGYEHSLSKRTILKAAYARIDNKDNAGFDFNVGAVGGGFGVGANPSVFSAGMRHSF